MVCARSVGVRAPLLLSVVFGLGSIACSDPTAPEQSDIEAVSAPYGLIQVDGIDSPRTDSITVMGVTGPVAHGSLTLRTTGTWSLSLAVQVGIQQWETATDEGTFSVERTDPQERCGPYECRLTFVGATTAFPGVHSGGSVLLELDGHEFRFVDQRV